MPSIGSTFVASLHQLERNIEINNKTSSKIEESFSGKRIGTENLSSETEAKSNRNQNTLRPRKFYLGGENESLDFLHKSAESKFQESKLSDKKTTTATTANHNNNSNSRTRNTKRPVLRKTQNEWKPNSPEAVELAYSNGQFDRSNGEIQERRNLIREIGSSNCQNLNLQEFESLPISSLVDNYYEIRGSRLVKFSKKSDDLNDDSTSTWRRESNVSKKLIRYLVPLVLVLNILANVSLVNGVKQVGHFRLLERRQAPGAVPQQVPYTTGK